jgi:N-methylhydantoinase A/oxoprolinase/acetone carboxylase beta subunit
MASLTEVVAAVVVHSSAVAFSHFGVALDAVQAERAQPVSERVVARTPRKLNKVSDCPDAARARTVKV